MAMVDIYMTRLHELTVIFYAVSVLLYFIDFLNITGRQTKLPSGYLHLFGFCKRFFYFTIWLKPEDSLFNPF